MMKCIHILVERKNDKKKKRVRVDVVRQTNEQTN